MDLQTVTVLITGISVIIAAVNSIFSSRRAEEQRALTLKTQQQALETRQAQLFMQIYNRWSTKEFADAYEKLRFVYKQEEWDAMLENMLKGKTEFDIDQVSTRQMVATYFEGLGMLVKQGLINIEMVKDLFSNRVIWYWETHVQPYADSVRQHLNDPTMYDSIEYLYNELKQRAYATDTA